MEEDDRLFYSNRSWLKEINEPNINQQEARHLHPWPRLKYVIPAATAVNHRTHTVIRKYLYALSLNFNLVNKCLIPDCPKSFTPTKVASTVTSFARTENVEQGGVHRSW
ncbi:unnamed protein product, partial [Heterotrigona itama]